MKKNLLLIFFFLCFSQLFYGQDEGVVALDIPIRNSIKFNRYIINPTFSFVREQNSYISLYNKRQWVEFENAPQTYLFGYSGRLGEKNGLGLSLFQQNYGILTTFGGISNFAHNVQLDSDTNLTFGVNLAIYKSGVNNSKVISNYSDPALDNIPNNFLATINPGINYGTVFLDFGVSINNLILYNIKTSEMVNNNPERSIELHAMHTGYLDTYGFFDKSKFSAILKTELKKEKTIVSGLVMFTIPNGIWAVGGYNTLYGASAGLGLNLTPKISIEYNFEKTIGSLSNFGTSHEITLAYKLKSNNYYFDDDETEGALFTPDVSRNYVATKAKTSKIVPNKPTVSNDKPLTPVDVRAPQADQIEAKTKADSIAQTKLKAEADAKAKADSIAKAKQLADAKLKAEVDAKAKADSIAQAKLLAEAKLKAEAKAKADSIAQAKQLAEAKLKAEMDAKAKADSIAKAKQLAEAKLKAEAEAKAKADSIAQAKQLADAKLKEEADAKAKADSIAQAKLLAEAKLKAEADAKAKADSIAQAKLLAEAKLKAEADAKAKADSIAQAKQLAEAKLKAEAEAKAKADSIAQAKQLAEAKIKAEADAKAKADSIAQAKQLAEAKLKVEADAKAKADSIAQAKQLAINKDDNAKSMDNLKNLIDEFKSTQEELLQKLNSTVASREKDLNDLKEENDLSEKGIFREPKPFKSVTAENNALYSLNSQIEELNKNQKAKITELENLYKERIKKSNYKNDVTSQYYLKMIATLKAEQADVIKTNTDLLASLEQIKKDTEIERKRRIKRASYETDETRYLKDVATLKQLKETTPLATKILKTQDFDFGEQQSDMQILKNIRNEETGYYVILAVHSDSAKRDEFLKKVISTGQKDINFFYDVNTSKYFIYSKKFDNLEAAKKAAETKDSAPYNNKMSIIKIEN